MSRPADHPSPSNDDRYAAVQAVFEDSAVGLARVDASGRYEALNDSFTQFVRQLPVHAAGKAFTDCVDEPDRAALSAELARLFAGDRHEFWFHSRTDTSSGAPLKLRFLIRAVPPERTALVLAQWEPDDSEASAYDARTQRLQAVNRMRDGMAHALNNMLGTVLGNLEFAREDCPNDASELREILDEAVDASRRAVAYLRRLQDCDRDPEQLGLPLDFVALVQRAIDTACSGEAARTTLTVSAEAPLTVRAIPELLEKSITEIIKNAVQATEGSDGQIRLSLSLSSESDQEIIDKNETGCVKLIVMNDGAGIDSAMADRVFEPFVTTRYPAKGMGLYFADNTIRNHGGSVTIDKRMQHGTKVEIRLPLCSHLDPEP